MTGVTELGYVVFGVSDLRAWEQFAGIILGLEIVKEEGGKSAFLRADEWHHRIALEQDGADDLIGAGLRVAGPAEFSAMQRNLSDHQIAFELGDAAFAAKRHVLEILRLEDPAGNPLEIFHGPRVDSHMPFYPARRMYGRFVTGTGGVGHMIMGHEDLNAQYEFYRLLGMRGSLEYRIPAGSGNTLDILFMHCNERDHTLAFGLPSVEGKHINHLMLEVDNLDDVYMTYELVKASSFPVMIDPGKHANDRMFSFYFQSPSGFQIEVGYGGRPATHQSEYYVRDTYGHQFQSPGDSR